MRFHKALPFLFEMGELIKNPRTTLNSEFKKQATLFSSKYYGNTYECFKQTLLSNYFLSFIRLDSVEKEVWLSD